MMSKIRNLFKKIRKKKNGPEVSGSQPEDSTVDNIQEPTLPEIPKKKKRTSFKKITKKMNFLKRNLKDNSNSGEERTFSKNRNLEKYKSKIQKIEWEKLPQLFFKSDQNPKYHRVFQVLTVCLLVFSVGKFSGLFLQGKKDYKNIKTDSLDISYTRTFKKENLNSIKSSDIFKTTKVKKTKAKKEEKKEDENIICKKADRKSSLSIKLINTIVLQDSVKSLASLKSGSEVLEYREGDKIAGKARLDKIERLRLIVKNNRSGQCEYIESSDLQKERDASPIATLSPKESKVFKKQLKRIDGIENVGNKFKIKKDFLKTKMKDISSLLTQARGIQINNPDGSISFKVVDIEPGGIFAYLGMQDGDIITNINGEPIKNLNDVMNLFGKVSNLSNLNLTLKRGGEEVTQDYSIQ